MSIDAQAHGGGVEAGGCVATLQAIGACKLPWCCTVVCMLLGGAGGGGIAAAMSSTCLGGAAGNSTGTGNDTLF